MAGEISRLQMRRLDRLNWRTLFTVSGQLDLADVTALDRYFRRFLPPGPCVGCGERLGVDRDDLLGAFLGRGTFTWGLVHGEGFCRACGYPGRAYHYDVGPIKTLPVILQYHPDGLVARGAA